MSEIAPGEPGFFGGRRFFFAPRHTPTHLANPAPHTHSATPRSSASPGPERLAPLHPRHHRGSGGGRRLALVAAAVVVAALAAAGAAALTTTTRVIPPADLAAATGGGDPPAPLWVAFLGDVFDVGTTEKGRTTYAPPDGPYSHFAGRDGTAAFVSGDFSDAGVTAALPDGALEDEDTVASLAHWAAFYASHPSYRRVGVTPGPWYDERGRKTAARLAVDAAVARVEGKGES